MKDEDKQILAAKYLNFGVEYGYLPSLFASSEICFQDPKLFTFGIEILFIAAEKYNSPNACYQIGLFFLHNSKTKEKSFYYINKAANELNFLPAKTIYGTMLSPLSEFYCPKKDGELSFKILNEIINKFDDPIALHEISKLYFKGIGCEINLNLAKELNEKAQKIDQNIPNLIFE